MFVPARLRFVLLFLTIFTLTIPALADDVTISGTVNFSSLDGSSLDHDGAANGTFAVSDGDLTVLGTINCNDDAATSACSMRFAVAGNFTMQPGAAISAENRNGGGQGGSITVTVGGNALLSGATATQAGALISTSNHDTAAGSAGGNVTFAIGGSATIGSGAIITAGAKGGSGGAISLAAEDAVSVNGLVASGPSATLASTRYNGTVLSGGSAAHSGGNITIVSHSHTVPAVSIGSNATIVSQGGSGSAGHVVVEGCGLTVNGLVASISRSGVNAKVTLRSGTSLIINSQDLGSGAGTRTGMVRADALDQSAASYAVNLFARENVSVHGPSGALYAVTSNGGTTSKDASGTITVMATQGAVTSGGNAFAAMNGDAGDQGGTINVSAHKVVTLGRVIASGDQSTSNPDRAGGTINVRSYTQSVNWQNGLGDVRPTGSTSGVPANRQGTITVTYCTSYSFTASSFPTNGPATGPFPATVQSCDPSGPALPAGEAHPECNRAPLTASDAYTVAEGGSLNVVAPGVLGNDVDPDGDPITAVLVSGPAHATSFTFNANGSFSYTHNGTENHTDSFTYRATDGSAESAVTTVAIAVTPVNDAPVAVNDNYSTQEGGTINYAAPGVLANDSDVDSPSLNAVLVSGPAKASSFVLNADGSFIYVHNGGETTSDSFTYKANDGALDSNVATVSISIAPVNDAPVAANDAYTVDEGGTLNAASVLGNDTDPDSSLSAILVNAPSRASSFVLNADGTFSYVHDGSETSSDSFTYKANDGSADSNVATVVITIDAVNDAPVAKDDDYSVDEDAWLIVPAPGVLGNDSDVDSASFTAVLVSGPSRSSVFTLNPNGSFSYKHNGSETTTDSFTYQANDGSAGSNVVTVTIAIDPVNDAPVASNDSASVAEGGTLNGSSLLANDSDAENAALTAVLVSGPSNASSFTLNADGTYTYVHNGSETTSDSFTYKANDGSLDSNVATVTISVTAVNDAPVADGDSYSVAEGGTLNVAAPGVLADDTDAENDTLTAVLVSGPSHATSFALNANGGFSYVHNGSETTSDSFSYKANDGSDDSNVVTVTITIAPVNDAPLAMADNGGSVTEGGTLNGASVLANDTDAENDSLTAVLVSGPSNAASFVLNVDGTFTYTHNGGETTSDSFAYKANDATSSSNIVTVAIAITAVNDAPVAQNDGPYSASSGIALNVAAPGVLANDSDVDGPSITAVLVSGPSHATSFALNADGSFSYTSSTIGTDSFTYVASDGSAQSNTVTVTINVASQPPVAHDDVFNTVGNTELRVGTGASATPHVAVTGSVLANDTDPDTAQGSLTVVSHQSATSNGGSVTMNPNGTFSYIPPAFSVAPDSFTYVVSDGVNSDTGTVHITFTGRVWYVRNNASAGSGRSHQPYDTLAAATVIAQANDTIYVHAGDGTMSGHAPIALQDGQRLIGQGVALVSGPYTLHPAGARPRLDAITLANGNEVAGLNVTSDGIGINGDMAVSGAIVNVGITGGSAGLLLTNTDGSFALTNVTVAPGGVGASITGTANITFNNVVVTTAGSTGIFGNGTGVLTFNGGSVSTTNAAAVDLTGHTVAGSGLVSVNASNSVNGISLQGTSGTFAVVGTGAAGSGGTISGMSGRAVNAVDAAGVTLKSMIINNSGLQGVLVNNNIAAASTVNVSSSSFSGNFGNAVQASSGGAGALIVNADGNTFANNNAAVIAQVVGAGGATVKITNNAATFNSAAPYGVTRNATGSGAVEATIANNTVGTSGVAGSGCGIGCGGIQVIALGSNTFKTLVSNNVVRQVPGTAITVRAGEGSASLSATISDNLVEQPVGTPGIGMLAQSGTLSTDTVSVCAHIINNRVNGSTTNIVVRNAQPLTTFSVPGYAGLGTDTTAVANFIKAQNTVSTVTALRKTTAPANQFSGGPGCATPAP